MKNKTPFDNILAKAGITKKQFNEATKGDTVDEKAYKKLKLVAKVLNGPDPGDCIYYPWFWKVKDATKPSGSGLSLDDVGYDDSPTGVASRLKYRTREIAKKAAETFLPEYEEYLLQ